MGCALPRSPVEVQTSEPKLPRAMRQDLHALAGIADMFEEASANRELWRLLTEADERHFRDYLRAQGYYQARVSHERRGTDTAPRIRYRVWSGPRFRLNPPTVHWPEDIPGHHPTPPRPGTHATLGAVAAMRGALLRDLQQNGYPRPKITNQTLRVDHATQRMDVHFEPDPGASATLGTVTPRGLNQLRPSYIRKALPWTPGEPYDIRKIERFERRLAASSLFSSIDIRRWESGDPDAVPDPDRWDLEVSLRERKARTIQLGVGYRTDTGGETVAQWQHRNAFGGGERVTVRGKVAEEANEAEMRLAVPYFRRSDQEWGGILRYRDERPDAYDIRGVEAETWIQRELHRTFWLRPGVALRAFSESQSQRKDSYLLLSLPLHLHWDLTNDRLDATRGIRLHAQTEPFDDMKDPDLFFWKHMIGVSGFIPLHRNRSSLIALRAAFGGIDGAALERIPADVRFYAGGGQSVRGYAHQALSPREDDDILGGRSLVETSLELRQRLGRSFGLVGFLDGGGAFKDEHPPLDDTLRWGVGAGVRYFTPVGPLRVDIGLPLNPRDGIDDDWQFYISIGQAF